MTYCNNGPCYGECANGERFRTQGIPKKSKELDYVHVMQVCNVAVVHSASKRSIRRFVITEKAPTRAFSCLKAATITFTFKILLRHNAKKL